MATLHPSPSPPSSSSPPRPAPSPPWPPGRRPWPPWPGRPGPGRMLWRIQTALERAGVEFIPEDDHKGPGVRLKERRAQNPSARGEGQARGLQYANTPEPRSQSCFCETTGRFGGDLYFSREWRSSPGDGGLLGASSGPLGGPMVGREIPPQQ